NETISKHAILRSCIARIEEDRSFQVVFKKIESPVTVHDLTYGEDAESRARAKVFELSRPPLFHCDLLRFDSMRHRVIWSYNHALLDEWSLNKLQEVIFEAYSQSCDVISGQYVSPGFGASLLEWVKNQEMIDPEPFWRSDFENYAPTPALAEFR